LFVVFKKIIMKKRREFLKKAGMGAALGAVAVAGASCRPQKKQSAAVQTKKKYEWKMATTWPKNFPGLGTGANLLAKRIGEMSEGQIEVKVFGGGELVPPLEAFNAVSTNTAQMGHGAAYYWKGKSEAAQFFAAVPFGLNADEMAGWIHYGGGQKLWDDIYADFNLKPFAAGNTGVQMGGWFNKEINSLDDLKGLKMRIPGLGGEVLKALGGTAVGLPGGEIFQALESKTIDATEWVGPYNDLAFGFYKITKFYYWPGWHEPGTVLETFVNKAAYDALPKNLQTVVEVAAQASYQDMFSEFTARNIQALDTLINEHGVILKRFPDSVLKKAGEASEDVISALINRDAASKKVYQSFDTFRKRAIRWSEIGEGGFAHARKLTFG
jgi:TRAP-type mannitol/chloroaromatic compound transport system substrate-binding protein